MLSYLLQILKFIRNFALKIFNKEFLFFLFFLILSGLLWLTNTLDDYYEYEFPINIRLAGIPKNVVIIGEPDSIVKVTLHDKGYVIANYIFRKQIRPLYFDFEANINNSNTGEIQTSDIQHLLSQQLYSSTKIVSIKAQRLKFSYNYGLSKKVPIKFYGAITPSKGYFLKKIKFSPDSVLVYATKNILDSIKYVPTKRILLSNISEQKSYKVAIANIYNTKIVPNNVRLQLFTDILTEEVVKVPIEPINVPNDKVLRIFPNIIKVKFVVGSKDVKRMSKNNETQELLPIGFRVVVDYKDIERIKRDKCKVSIKNLPAIVKNAQPIPQMVDYLIEQK